MEFSQLALKFSHNKRSLIIHKINNINLTSNKIIKNTIKH